LLLIVVVTEIYVIK